ncbi:MAG: hypothetical protein IPM47_04705 [Sphingobacteriales bacterium]|nr:MAG: hypothetical protein IPM47_04705 [Sphingobacteriales bacterium]
MKKLMNFAAVAIAVIGSFFATNHANAQTILASPSLTPEQVVNYVVQNYTVVHFTIASNETADNKIMPVSTWATGSMAKTNAACKSLKSAATNRYHTQADYADDLFDQQDQVELTLKGTGCAGEATLKRGATVFNINIMGVIKGAPGVGGKDTYLLYGTYGNGKSFITISLWNFIPVG